MTIERLLKYIRNTPPEAVVWLSGFVVLALLSPYREHYSFCLFHNLGITFCPGCGLGRSISYLLHGDIGSSLRTHLLGIPATAILASRIMVLLSRHLQSAATTINPIQTKG